MGLSHSGQTNLFISMTREIQNIVLENGNGSSEMRESTQEKNIQEFVKIVSCLVYSNFEI